MSWLSSAFHAVTGSKVVQAAANIAVPGSGQALAAADSVHIGGGGDSSSSTVAPPVTTTAANPQGQMILLGLAALGLILVTRHPAAKS